MRTVKTTVSLQRRLELEKRARWMRRSPTAGEFLLWRELKSKKQGVQFRRQAVLLGRFIVDFYAASVGLVVELDGGYHAERARADARRDAALERAGYRVLRLSELLVTSQLEVAVARVRDRLG